MIKFTRTYGNVIEKENIIISGSLFVENILFSVESLLDELKSIVNIEQLEYKLSSYNGFFAFVINRGYEVFAAVDRIRSIPIFYGKTNSDFYISNDATWVHENVLDDRSFSPMAQQEFLLTGYVTGQDTLWENIKQLQAGEYLHLKDNNGSMEIVTKRYYRFLHKEPCVLPEIKLLQKKLDGAMDSIIRRLITYANGRQIVIPLSAGRDSRLIALKLRQFGYQNVICFSYGVTGNFEAETSKKVAGLLGFAWEFVEYTEELWKEWFDTTEREKYFDMACNWVSLPVIQDWPAVWELKKHGIVDATAIFVPGHTGDFISGSHIPSDAEPGMRACMKDLVSAISRSHYSLVEWSKKLKKIKKYFENRIIKNCEIKKITNGYEYADAFEKWDWQERQAKFIVNSIRVYEFFGFDWWLPFWDNEFMFYWMDVPLQYRKNKILYNECVDNLYEAITRDKSSTEIETYNEKNKYIKFMLKKLHLYYLALEINDYIRKRRLHPTIHACYGVFSEEFKEKYKGKTDNINGLSAIFILTEMGEDIDFILR
jgi:asparagine synthase (glutamine-hydrolysing)